MPESENQKAKKSKRGGKRPGAGRKPKARRSPTALTEIDIVAARSEPLPGQIEEVAQRHTTSALASLLKVMIGGAGDQARVNAACSILDRAYGKPAIDAGGIGGGLFADDLPRAFATKATEIRDAARRNAVLAIEVLHRIAIASESEGARVSASRALLDRGLGTVAPAKVPDELNRATLGKREQQVADAKAAATGIFETPKPPGRLQ